MNLRRDAVRIVPLLIVALLVSPPSAAKKKPEPPRTKEEALQREMGRVDLVKQKKKLREDQIDCELRLAKMAMDAGRNDYAREILVEVTQKLSELLGEKGFTRHGKKALRALGGEESDKYFLGEPYEQLFAFIYLGILDFQAGDYEMARSSFRSALLADQVSTVEGYKSDCYLALLLEGITSKALGDMDAAEDAFLFAERAYLFRKQMEVLPGALNLAASTIAPESSVDGGRKQRKAYAVRKNQVDASVGLMASYLPIGLSTGAMPEEGLKLTFDLAVGSLGDAKKGSAAKEYLDQFSKDEYSTLAVSTLEGLRNAAIAKVSLERGIAAHVEAARSEFQEIVRRCRDPKVNAYLIHEVGLAPAKRREGMRGEELVFNPYPEQSRRRLFLLRREEDPNVLAFGDGLQESVEYQALTRGGRAIDAILKRQAKTRRGLNVTADIVEQLGAPGDVLAGMIDLVSNTIHAEADVRAWDELPNELGFVSLALEPGRYAFRSENFDVVGRVLPEERCVRRFTVADDLPTVVLSGNPWR